MIYVNVSNKNIVLYGSNDVKYVFVNGDSIDSAILPEVATHPAFKAVTQVVVKEVVKDNSASEITTKMAQTVSVLEGKVENLQALMLELSKEVAVLQAAKPAEEPKKTTREPKV